MTDNKGQCRVIVVDDDALVRGLLVAILSGLGADVIGQAENGKEAVAAYTEHKPDIMFMDIQMPVKNGIDALKEIIEIDPGAFVVMLTATSEMDVADNCISSGARNYIRKGAPPDVLQILIKGQLDLFLSE